MNIVGIDYAMGCPAICGYTGGEFNFENCTFHYLIDKKNPPFANNIIGDTKPDYVSQEERFDWISTWALSQVLCYNPDLVVLEDYSFGSRGRVFHIAENTGLLKHKLFKTNTPFIVVAPTKIKKFATNKGNANKDLMYEKFTEQEGIDLKKELDTEVEHPISDIVDSFYLAKYGYSELIRQSELSMRDENDLAK